MTKNDAKILKANPDLLQAFIDGKLEYRSLNDYDKWYQSNETSFDFSRFEYRRKKKKEKIVIVRDSSFRLREVYESEVEGYKNRGWEIFDAVERL